MTCGILMVMTSYACMAFPYMVALMGRYFSISQGPNICINFADIPENSCG